MVRALLLPVPQAVKISASKLIHFFSSHSTAFGLPVSLPPDNITLNPAKKRTDQTLIFRLITAHATLDTEQLISLPELLLLIQLPLYRVQMVKCLQLQKCTNYLQRFMTLWAVLCLNHLVIQLVF